MTDRPPDQHPGSPLPPKTRYEIFTWRDLLFGIALGAGFAVGLWSCARLSPKPAPPAPVAVLTPVSTVVAVSTPIATQPPRIGPTPQQSAFPVPAPALPVAGTGGLLGGSP